MEQIIDEKYLEENPNHIFVFGDNTIRKGIGGAAALRYNVNVYGFITKKFPGGEDDDYYKPEEYEGIFYNEISKLLKIIKDNPDKLYLISKLGAGLANRFLIYDKIIKPKLKRLLSNEDNVKFLYDDDDIEYDWFGYVDHDNRAIVFKYEENKKLFEFLKDTQINETKKFKATTKEDAVVKLLDMS